MAMKVYRVTVGGMDFDIQLSTAEARKRKLQEVRGSTPQNKADTPQNKSGGDGDAGK